MPVTRTRLQASWVLSAEAFDRLLGSLDANREKAAVRYERLRQKLTAFFDWRGLSDPETAVDETFDRVARRLSQGEPIEHITSYAYGVARIVLKEALRLKKVESDSIDALEREAPPEPDAPDEQRQACLDECLDSIPSRNRGLILRYYHHLGGSNRPGEHRNLAAELGLSSAALRVTAYRIRLALEKCVDACMTERQV